MDYELEVNWDDCVPNTPGGGSPGPDSTAPMPGQCILSVPDGTSCAHPAQEITVFERTRSCPTSDAVISCLNNLASTSTAKKSKKKGKGKSGKTGSPDLGHGLTPFERAMLELLHDESEMFDGQPFTADDVIWSVDIATQQNTYVRSGGNGYTWTHTVNLGYFSWGPLTSAEIESGGERLEDATGLTVSYCGCTSTIDITQALHYIDAADLVLAHTGKKGSKSPGSSYVCPSNYPYGTSKKGKTSPKHRYASALLAGAGMSSYGTSGSGTVLAAGTVVAVAAMAIAVGRAVRRAATVSGEEVEATEATVLLQTVVV